jgi:hypothetical protein
VDRQDHVDLVDKEECPDHPVATVYLELKVHQESMEYPEQMAKSDHLAQKALLDTEAQKVHPEKREYQEHPVLQVTLDPTVYLAMSVILVLMVPRERKEREGMMDYLGPVDHPEIKDHLGRPDLPAFTDMTEKTVLRDHPV